jgi:branched-chain amino acid transport system substrate-binding protein
VKDFAPYVAKIKAVRRRHRDHRQLGLRPALLVKAANDAGLTAKFYTYYAGVTGTPTALGKAGAGRVFQVGYGHYNMGGATGHGCAEFKKKFNDDFYTGATYTS